MKIKLLCFSLLLAIGATNAAVRYVTISGCGDKSGTSWANASDDLQNMINALGNEGGGDIWLAAGTYIPSHKVLDSDYLTSRDNAFLMKPNVKIYGGFTGNETNFNDRNWQHNETKLSGNRSCYHVVIFAGEVGSACLDGLTITEGEGRHTDTGISVNGYYIWRCDGGAIHVTGGSPTLRNLKITQNYSARGGAIAILSGSPILNNITITNNEVTGDGGGIFNGSSSNPEMQDITISHCAAAYNGGGIFNSLSSLALVNATITNNAAINGGGMYNNNISSISVTNSTIGSNTATTYGGGIYNNSSSSPILQNVRISGNSAERGGGIYNNANSSPVLNASQITSNNANLGGGMYNTNVSSPALTLVSITDNQASQDGGGMYNNNSSSPALTSVTMSENKALNNGGGMYNNNSSAPVINFTSISENEAAFHGAGIYNSYSSPVLENKTIIKNNAALFFGGGIFNMYSSPNISDVTFHENSAKSGGGVFNDQLSCPKFINTTISKNNAGEYGGGMYNNNGSSPVLTQVIIIKNEANQGGGMINFNSSAELTNVTMTENIATTSGSAIYNNFSSPKIYNSIIWGNTNGDASINDMVNITGSQPAIYYSLVSGYASTTNGNLDGTNSDNDPLFEGSNKYTLSEDSPCIDAGNNTYINNIDFDFAGNIRIFNDVVDMGAYESPYMKKKGEETGNRMVTNNGDIKIWTSENKLYLESKEPAYMQIYSIAGILLTQQNITAGNTVKSLPQGIYVVVINGKATKVIIK